MYHVNSLPKDLKRALRFAQISCYQGEENTDFVKSAALHNIQCTFFLLDNTHCCFVTKSLCEPS